MFGRMTKVFLVMVLLVAAGSWGQEKAQEEQNVLGLTLEDAILRTLKNNYGVAIQILGPEIADEAVAQASAIFYPDLGVGYNSRNNETPSYSWLEGTGTTISDNRSYGFSISQLLPIGGQLSVSLNNYKNSNNSRLQTVNPRYGSTLSFDLQQPLLRNFGLKMTRINIITSQNNYDIAVNDLDSTIMDVVYRVESAYWNLAYSIENLKVRQQALQLAEDLLAKNERAVEVGTLAPIEIVSAQAEVATRRADIISAQADVKSNEDLLRTIINLPPAEMKQALPIVPLDKPGFETREVNLDEALAAAMQNRPELKSLKIGIDNRNLQVSYARNQLLPNLNLSASYYSQGIAGDQIVYLDNNPLTGVVVNRIPGPPSDALKDALGFKYNNWTVGLTLDIPLSTVFSRAALAQAKLNLDQAELQLKNQEQTIYLEIRDAVRSVQANYERVQAYKVARELADKKLAAEEEKLKVGLSTNFNVLTYQRDLSTARISELRAIVDYTISLANVERAMGTTLKTKNINIYQMTKS
jgi:outer membrane protein TolC